MKASKSSKRSPNLSRSNECPTSSQEVGVAPENCRRAQARPFLLYCHKCRPQAEVQMNSFNETKRNTWEHTRKVVQEPNKQEHNSTDCSGLDLAQEKSPQWIGQRQESPKHVCAPLRLYPSAYQTKSLYTRPPEIA